MGYGSVGLLRISDIFLESNFDVRVLDCKGKTIFSVGLMTLIYDSFWKLESS